MQIVGLPHIKLGFTYDMGVFGTIARSVACLLIKQRSGDRPLQPANSFVERSCQLLAKGWTLYTAKLAQGRFLRNTVVK